jgi:hypothetical protein
VVLLLEVEVGLPVRQRQECKVAASPEVGCREVRHRDGV